jgi:ATP phosphoribosyltransferase regulatory subunit
MPLIPDGTRYTLPPEWEWRESLRERLELVLKSWGYEAIHTPAIERFDAAHPQAAQSFKLVDRDGSVLALRGEWTTAVASLVRAVYPNGPWPLRLRYAGQLWTRSREVGIGRGREFSQVGGELIGVSTPLADAEIVTLSLELLAAVGVSAALELGHPGFVRSVIRETALEGRAREALVAAVHRKNTPDLLALLDQYGIGGRTRTAVLALTDLYGGAEVLAEARQHALNSEAREALDWLRGLVAALPPQVAEALLFDLGAARRLDYYTGVLFQAYTPDFNQPLVGGGRYDSAPDGLVGLPAVGFSFGLERLMAALGGPPALTPPDALALDPLLAASKRAQGWRVEAAWTHDEAALLAYAQVRGIKYLLKNAEVIDLAVDLTTDVVAGEVA